MKSNCLVKLITALALLPLALLQSGCIGDDNSDCFDRPEAPESAVFDLVYIVPNTLDQRRYLDLLNYPCFRDSIMVYQENGQPALDFSLSQNGRISFTVNTFQQDHSAAFRTEVRKRFQLYINYREIHYIEFRYMMYDTGCSQSNFTYIETYYNNVLMVRDENYPEIRGLIFDETPVWSPC